MTNEYGVGILGYGFIGKVHAYGYRTLDLFYDPAPLRPRLVGVCTSRAETARKAKADGHFEFATTDYREIIERDDIQIINICTPNSFHKEQLLAAIRAGKHIYCDKPLVVDLEEADEIERALADYTGVGQMTLQYRFYPPTLRAKQMIEEGFLGNVISFRGVYLHSGSVDPEKKMGWKQQTRFGGGLINDLGSHILDLLDHLIGPFDSVIAENRILYETRPNGSGQRVPVEAEDQSAMLLRLPNGAIGTVEVSKIATGANDELRFEIHGDRGALRFNLLRPDVLEAYDLRAPESPIGGTRGFIQIDTGARYDKPAGFPGPKFTIGWLRGHMHCLYNFLCGVAEGRQVTPSLARGIQLQRMLATVRQSTSRRQWLSFTGT